MSMTREELMNAPYEAPVTRAIRVGRVLLFIGSILLFIAAAANILEFGLSLANPDFVEIDLSNPLTIIHLVFLIPAAVFLVLVGIGGISFARNHGPLLRWCSIGAICLIVFILIDFVVDTRSLVRNLIEHTISARAAWLNYLSGFVGIQIFGGIFFLGWMLAKTYLG